MDWRVDQMIISIKVDRMPVPRRGSSEENLQRVIRYKKANDERPFAFELCERQVSGAQVDCKLVHRPPIGALR
jgi:hypothetical protein